MYTVYSLIDPRNDTVRYVGITDDVYARFYQHLRCDGSNKEKDDWISELKAENRMLIMKTLEEVEILEETRVKEQKWIRHYLSRGIILLNLQINQSFSFEQFTCIMGSFKEPVQEIEYIPDPNLIPIEAFKYHIDKHGIKRKNTYISFEDAVTCTGYTVEELKILVKKDKVKLASGSIDRLILSSLMQKPHFGENVFKKK